MTVNDFDFRKPPAGSLEKKIAGWLKDACSLAQSKWASYLAFPAELELLKAESVTTGTALQRLPDGSIALSLAVQGYPEDNLLLGMSRPVLLSLIGGTFGEVYKVLPADRDLSPVEESVANFLVQELVLNLVQRAWPLADPLQLSIVARGLPKAVCTLPVAEMIILATITYTGPFGSQPLFLLMQRGGLTAALSAPANEVPKVEPVDREHIESLVRDMAVDVSVVLGSAEVTLTQLATLQAGDVVVLGQKISEPLRAKVSGTDKFQVWPGVVGRRQAIQIETTVEK